MEQYLMYDVAIVGYGPVGATLAGLLGKLDLSVAVFEKTKEIYPKPRAVGFDHDAMRLFQRLGVSESIKPYIEPFREEIYVGVDDRVLQHFKHMEKPYPLTWNPHFTCNQPSIEKVLRDANANLPNIHVALGAEFIRFEQSLDHLKLHIKDSNNQSTMCEAKYLIGCDGASSPIRRQIGFEMENFDYDEHWIVVDMKVKKEFLTQLPNVNVQYCKPQRPSTMICCPGNHRRWEFMTIPGDNLDDIVSENRIWDLLKPWIKPSQAEIWRAAAYRFHALVAKEWQDERVFLAGDSAHQTPPFLGQGMCQGLRDAGNLAWKLKHVISNQADESLLETYTQERRPNVLATTKLAKECGLIISERDPQKAKERDEKILSENNGDTKFIPRQELIPPLDSGLIDLSSPLAGSVFPQPIVNLFNKPNILMDDLTEPCFRLVVLEEKISEYEILQINQQAIHLKIKIIILKLNASFTTQTESSTLEVIETLGIIRKWLNKAGCIGAIVRPDHYVYSGIVSSSKIADCMSVLSSQLRP